MSGVVGGLWGVVGAAAALRSPGLQLRFFWPGRLPRGLAMRARDESPDLGGSIHSPSCSKTEAEEQNGRSEARDGVWRSAREQF